MGSWNINERNLNTNFAYPIFIQDEYEDEHLDDWQFRTEEFWDNFWEQNQKNIIINGERKGNFIEKNNLLATKTITKYGQDFYFKLPLSTEAGYHANSYLKIDSIDIVINDSEEFDMEGLEFEINQNYDSDSVFGILEGDKELTQARAKQILKSIKKAQESVLYEVNRMLHYFTGTGESGGWCGGQTTFADLYTKPHKYKHFDFQEN